MRRTEKYAAMTKDAAQRSRWTFYEAVILWVKYSQLLEFFTILEVVVSREKE